MESDLPVENIVDDLALQDKPGMIIFEQPDLICVNGCRGLEVGNNIIVIILASAPVPYAVFRERPGIIFEEIIVELWHMSHFVEVGYKLVGDAG
jgi:hypothetical protein